MKIKNLFKKDINRNIKGVIKVDQKDEASVYQELDEYVVTSEMERHMRAFFNAYCKSLNEPTDDMGIWISGFFGSGKSHFLKILSYLFENKEVRGRKALDFFQNEIADPTVMGDIEKVTRTGTKDVILFNIDSKAEVNNKTKKDAIVKVFLKAFNDYLGYCGEIPWLAELERILDERELYDKFKTKFLELSGQKWEKIRGTFHLMDRENVIKAYADTTGILEESARLSFDQAEKNYTLSSEKLSGSIIKKYIERKGDHRILFLVDEIGQYIGDNTELMLNLQTITEDLGRFLHGKVWVVVTSQEAVDKITMLEEENFSKIRGRFATQISLSSENTDEVIKKRVLEKTKEGKNFLKAFYTKHKDIIKNTICFSSDAYELRPYKNSEEFIKSYPFIPYQFPLLQKVFEKIRIIGAAGAHLASGARSMLSGFQEASKIIGNLDIGKLAPFSLFYESVENFIYSGIRKTIRRAQNNPKLQKQDINLLKILFMIKYIDQFSSNLENLTTLSVKQVDEDKVSLRKSVKGSLERLEKETLINKNRDEYEFLTDEEQDINKQIKNTGIEQEEISNYIGRIIFEEVYPDQKIKYNSINQFPFNKIVDSRTLNPREHEISLKIVTPLNHDYTKNHDHVAFKNLGNLALIVFKEDLELIENVKKELKIQKFLRLKSPSSKNDCNPLR